MERGFSRIPSGTRIFADFLKSGIPCQSVLRSIRVNPRPILNPGTLG